MNKYFRMIGIGFIATAAFTGCKSKSEAAGDAYLKAGDAGNALSQYENALQEGPVSDGFYSNYIQTYVQFLQARAGEDPGAETLDPLRDTLVSLLKQHPSPGSEAQVSAILADVGRKRLDLGTPQAVESGFKFFQAAASLPGKAADVDSKFNEAKQAYVSSALKDVESKLADTASDPNAGVAADYEMNQIALVTGEENAEMKALWSKIREKNLNTYLFYGAPGLLEQVDARINKYGMLLAIVKYTRSPMLIGIKVWNSTSGPVEFDGSDFRLVDRQGNSYEPAVKLQAFRKKALVEMGKESEVGGLTFKLPKDAEPDYLELKVADGRTSRKYLP